MNMYSQTFTVPYFPCNCQGTLLSPRVLVARYSWVENKFHLGMVMGSDMVLGVLPAQYPCASCFLLSFFPFFPLIRNQDSNLISCKLGTLTITCKSQMPAPPVPHLKCQIQHFVVSDDVTWGTLHHIDNIMEQTQSCEERY